MLRSIARRKEKRSSSTWNLDIRSGVPERFCEEKKKRVEKPTKSMNYRLKVSNIRLICSSELHQKSDVKSEASLPVADR